MERATLLTWIKTGQKNPELLQAIRNLPGVNPEFSFFARAAWDLIVLIETEDEDSFIAACNSIKNRPEITRTDILREKKLE